MLRYYTPGCGSGGAAIPIPIPIAYVQSEKARRELGSFLNRSIAAFHHAHELGRKTERVAKFGLAHS